MDQVRLRRLRELLEEEKRELLQVVEGLTGPGGLESPADEADRELSAYDNHPADYGSQMYERSKDLGLLQATRQHLLEIEEAEKAMAAGTYGICQGCGGSIPEERLLAVPSTRFCVDCKKEREQEDAAERPVEEEALRRQVDDEIAGKLDYMFDQDSAWEEVAQFGTSNSPAEEA
ncbi:MAG: conjugal transfer protein TraR [Firmicutes bacterium]|nr:conjugal transfer protein TraR [Bacillota bacterium]